MTNQRISVLGLGAMGAAVAETLLATGHEVTVWNRTPAKADPLVGAGAAAAATVDRAVDAADVVVVVLLDHVTVRDRLDPVGERLRGKTVVNLTTTSPNEARATAAWAAAHGIDYLDGAIMAVPHMIGEPEALLLYSGSETAFAAAEPTFAALGRIEFVGTDPGVAALKDMALLSAMDLMFSGLIQAVAMMRTVGTSAVDTADEVAAWLGAMLPELKGLAAIIDGGTYQTGDQSVDFTRAGAASMITASREQGIRADLLEPAKRLLDEQSAVGNGGSDWVRVVESLTIRK